MRDPLAARLEAIAAEARTQLRAHHAEARLLEGGDWSRGFAVESQGTVHAVRGPGWLAAPLLGPHGALGVLQVGDKREGDFDADDERALGRLAAHAAIAIQHARLEEERERLVAIALETEERTRARIAELLHDEVLQDLLVARQDLAEALAGDDAPSEALVRDAHVALERASRALRERLADLYPVASAPVGLQAGLRAAAEAAAGRGGFALELDLEGAGDAADPLLLALGRELLANAARHAHARRVRVALKVRPDGVRLEVADDGRGIAAGRRREAARGGHLGLVSVEQRVAAVAGRMGIESRPGAGTRAWVELPRERPIGGDPPSADGAARTLAG